MNLKTLPGGRTTRRGLEPGAYRPVKPPPPTDNRFVRGVGCIWCDPDCDGGVHPWQYTHGLDRFGACVQCPDCRYYETDPATAAGDALETQ